MNSSFKKNYTQILKRVDSAIKSYKFGDESVGKAAAYSMGAGGKRLRPVILTQMAKYRNPELKNNTLNPIPAAIALECIHTFSLIHDDLPAIDNATLRRGKKACHKAYGEATALLAGDLLLNEAYQILAKNYPADIARRLVAELSATTRRVIEGENADIEAERKAIKNVDLDFIYANKTAAMFGAPVRMGMIIAGWPDKSIRPLANAAQKMGIAFQLVDDLLDITSNKKKLGKDVNQDVRKKTFLKKNGKTWCEQEAQRLSQSALRTYKKYLGENSFMVGLTQWLLQRDY